MKKGSLRWGARDLTCPTTARRKKPGFFNIHPLIHTLGCPTREKKLQIGQAACAGRERNELLIWAIESFTK